MIHGRGEKEFSAVAQHAALNTRLVLYYIGWLPVVHSESAINKYGARALCYNTHTLYGWGRLVVCKCVHADHADRPFALRGERERALSHTSHANRSFSFLFPHARLN
jgi:hypothetical protein